MYRALIRNIIRQSVVDGPGNRVAIFFQGCNIHCAYCHNPETQPLAHGTEDMEGCRWMSVEEVVSEVQSCMPFIRGITVSGGECMIWHSFITALFRECKSLGLTCLIDSNGTFDFTLYKELLDLSDGVMLDVKAWNPHVFHHLTGGSNTIVKKNIDYLYDQDKLYEVRIVCIEGEVDVEETIREVKQRVPVDRIRLLKFRPHGVIGRLANAPSPSDEQMERWEKIKSC